MKKTIIFTILILGIVFLTGMTQIPPAAGFKPAATISSFMFVSWGDAQDGGKNTQKTSNQIVSLINPAFTIFNGDLDADGFTIQASNTMVDALNGNKHNGLYNKTFLVRGNHDILTSYPIATWDAYFNPAAKAAAIEGIQNFNELKNDLSYSFDYGNSRFLALDLAEGAENLTLIQANWLDQRLTNAETSGLVHAFIYFHHPIYCLESVHCSCQAVKDSECINSNTNDLIAIINKHAIVSATFHGDEHLLAWTHINAARISGVTHEFEQFTTSPAGAGVYNKDLFPLRVDYIDKGKQQGFASIDVNGQDFTVNFYRNGTTAPVWSKTFSKNGESPVLTLSATGVSPATPASILTVPQIQTATGVLTPAPALTPTASSTAVGGAGTPNVPVLQWILQNLTAFFCSFNAKSCAH